MPRNISPAARLNEARLGAIVRSTAAVKPPRKGSDCVGESATGRDVPQRAAKTPTSRLPRPKIVRIQQRYVAGQNQTQIAKLEKCDRETVSRIVRSSEMAEYIERMKEEFRGLVPDAIAALRHTLQTQKDGRLAYEVLRDTGVAPRKGEPLESLEKTPMDGYTRQCVMLANVLLENEKHFGKMPANMVEAIKKIESH